MPSTLVDLRPDRRLLDPEFEGYKLNLQALPHHSLELPAVERAQADEAQYSFVHAKLFALHNHLVLDHWGYNFDYYYVSSGPAVQHVTFDSASRAFRCHEVYRVPLSEERKSGHFNVCVAFPARHLALVSDGAGFLHVVETGAPRQTWRTLGSSLVLGEDKYFVIVDSRLQETNGKEILHCLLQSVEQSEQHFDSVLTWVTFHNDDSAWNQMSFRQLRGKGIVHYAAIETGCDALYIASDHTFKFVSDSEREIQKPSKEEPREIIYTWLQTTEDITITLKLEANFNKKNLKVMVTPFTIIVSYAGKNFVDGKLSNKVDSELTTWHVQEDGQVDILLTKSESMLWSELLEGGDRSGEQVLDAGLVAEAHQRLAHLCSETEVSADQSVPGLSTQELEECDAASEEDTVLVRIDAKDHQISHRVPLSVNQFLFSIRTESQEVPALAVRQHVDACVWQPYARLVNSDTWPLRHQGTLMAFGYVQSSKQNKKFVTCPPNFSYGVVCEATKHVFIYRNSSDPGMQLRKRSGGNTKQVKVGQQHVFNVDKMGEVLGINASNEFLFLLTEKQIVAIQIL